MRETKLGADMPRTPSWRLDGRRALVTGAGRGIGMAAAVALAEAGADVTLVARSAPEVQGVATALRAAGHRASAATLDVTDAESVARFVRETGPYPILVNNAGTNRPAPLTDTPDGDIDVMLDLNVRAALVVAREVVRGLVAAGQGGSIIQISSQMGHVGAARRTVYCASKHALEGMTKALACEVGPHGIRVNSVCPTFIATDMTRAQLERQDFRAEVLAKIPLGRLGELCDIMGPVVFLASDAAALMTGASLLVDGGWTAA
ncbi:SDR family NAD(P)-dependent oxidoreductase [Ramlibacter sp.]|uniref:SDR family NAD(P)-dependent oxidoreductase n=1 Tax=Ramlibacter sp. TaxID=1917967 RepID=UPI003D0A0F33